MVTSALAGSETSFSTDFAFFSLTLGILNVLITKYFFFGEHRRKTSEELFSKNDFVVMMLLIQLLPC